MKNIIFENKTSNSKATYIQKVTTNEPFIPTNHLLQRIPTKAKLKEKPKPVSHQQYSTNTLRDKFLFGRKLLFF